MKSIDELLNSFEEFEQNINAKEIFGGAAGDPGLPGDLPPHAVDPSPLTGITHFTKYTFYDAKGDSYQAPDQE